MKRTFVVFLCFSIFLALITYSFAERRAQPYAEEFFLENSSSIFVGKVLEVETFRGEWTFPTKAQVILSIKGNIEVGVREMVAKNPGRYAIFGEEFDQATVGKFGVFFVGNEDTPNLLMKYKQIPDVSAEMGWR